MNIRFNFLFRIINKIANRRYLTAIALLPLLTGLYPGKAHASTLIAEPVQACVRARDVKLNEAIRAQFARCLGWQDNSSLAICHGSYGAITIPLMATAEEVHIKADEVSFYNEGRSRLTGHVEIQQNERIVNAQTAYVYRDAKSNKVTRVELLGEVRYVEADKLMIARRAIINPQDQSGKVEDVLYRFNSQRRGAILPAWGRASLIERFANKNYLLRRATYTNCPPQDKAWQIEADSITLDHVRETGVARHAILRIGDWPVVYSPYFSFPTSKKRKSGFLMPTFGSTNIGGFDYAQPYYWNMAPNYDATLIPHYYSRRGLMLGGQFRYLTPSSAGIVNGNFLPGDRAFKQFLQEKQTGYPWLRDLSTDRWSFDFHNSTYLAQNLHLGLDFQQISDDYYLQDFSSNMAVMTMRQLLRQGNLTYTTNHWLLRAMVESYQTLNPINETPIAEIYRRQPQLLAQGEYNDLPLGAHFTVLGQYDQFHIPREVLRQQGPRYHLNPILAFPQVKSWGYVTPAIELVENYYQVSNTWYPFWQSNISEQWHNQFNRTIPRYSIDAGLFFDRPLSFGGQTFTQTLEPRFFYLKVPYHDQAPIPVYDSAYMIFNADQLFRTNRFSGFDRIGDMNQFSYALTSRWLSEQSGTEKLSFSVGQTRYFSDRKVQLCQSITGNCVDNPLTLGFLSPTAKYSPVAARATYHWNPALWLTGDYIWNTATHSTNNANLAFHYQPGINQILNLGYTYLVNGDIAKVAYSGIESNPLHQATISYAWPLTERWSSIGAYSYNISKRYEMASFLGLQYDSCCWGVRLLGGRSFQSLSPQLQPQYNNNIYLQIVLKGLGSAGNSDPASIIQTYLPGYIDEFRH